MVMKKGLVIFGLCFLLVMMGFVSAMLYAEKVKHPEEFVSIKPIWSAMLESESGEIFVVSYLWFDTGGDNSGGIFFLNNVKNNIENQYLFESTNFYYAQSYKLITSGCPNYKSEGPSEESSNCRRDCLGLGIDIVNCNNDCVKK